MDSYQAIYDAVRSRIGNGDIGYAVTSAIQDAQISWHAERAAEQIRACACGVESEMIRPSVLFRPRLSIDGNKWCALYGDNLQDGVAGFGSTPNEAMLQFDLEWLKGLTPNSR